MSVAKSLGQEVSAHSEFARGRRFILSACCCLHVRPQNDLVREGPVSASTISDKKNQELKPSAARNSSGRPYQKENVSTVYDLPPGWKAVNSRSRPDRTAFLNEFTGERISWVPTEPASTQKGEIRRSKRRSKANFDRDSARSADSEGTDGRGGSLVKND